MTAQWNCIVLDLYEHLACPPRSYISSLSSLAADLSSLLWSCLMHFIGMQLVNTLPSVHSVCSGPQSLSEWVSEWEGRIALHLHQHPGLVISPSWKPQPFYRTCQINSSSWLISWHFMIHNTISFQLILTCIRSHALQELKDFLNPSQPLIWTVFEGLLVYFLPLFWRFWGIGPMDRIDNSVSSLIL